VLGTGFAMVFLFVTASGLLLKSVHYDGENELLLRFPVSGKDIYTAKAVYALFIHILTAYIIMMPIYCIYGYLTRETASFYFIAIAIIPLAAAVPFSFANMLVMPLISVSNALKSRFTLVLLFLIIATVAAFTVYMLLLQGIVIYTKNKTDSLFSVETRVFIRRFAQYLYPFSWFANILSGAQKQPVVSLIMIVLFTAAVIYIAHIVLKKTASKIILKGIDTESEAKNITASMRVHSPFTALLKKEFSLIFRSINYSFQYLALAASAPVMVYLCNSLAASVGGGAVGARILPGLSLLIIIIFTTITISFAGSAISREGAVFYLSKIFPVPYRTQIAVKFTLYTLVPSASNVLSCLGIMAFTHTNFDGAVTYLDIGCIWAISQLVIVALVANALNGDIKHPSFSTNASNEVTGSDKASPVNMIVGVAIAAVSGFAVMLTAYTPFMLGGIPLIKSTELAYLYLLIGLGAFAVIELLLLFVNAAKKLATVTP
jgi:hypothetical protein